MKLLELKTKTIILIVLILETIFILNYLILLPINEAFFVTEMTSNVYKEHTGGDWPKNYINYPIIIIPIIIFCALYFSNTVKKKIFEIKNYLIEKVTEEASIQQYETQFNIWANRIYGKSGLILFFLGYLSGSMILFIYFFPVKFHLWFFLFQLIQMFTIFGITSGLIIWVIFISFGTAKIISDFCKWNLKINPFHEDKVGGLKPIGNISLLNAFNLTIQLSLLILYWIFNNLVGFSDIITVVWTYVFFILGISLTFMIFYYPIKNIHFFLIQYKKGEFNKIDKSYLEYYTNLDNLNGKEKSNVLLNLLAFQSIKNELNQFRDYPWDTKIIVKLLSSYIIPILVFILNQVYGLGI